MIDQITKNNIDIESCYNIGSIHGDIRMMLSKYIYDEITLKQVIDMYSATFGDIYNLNIDLQTNTITFDTTNDTFLFQKEFAHCMYFTIGTLTEKLNDCIDMFEKDNPKYKAIKEKLSILSQEEYYITLFRTAFIKHEKSVSCIIQL